MNHTRQVIRWLLIGLMLTRLVSGTALAAEHRIKVLTSFLPLYCFSANVAGELAEVSNLLPPGVDPHDFQFSPSDIKKLESADVVVLNGLGLEAWFDRMLQSSSKPKCIVEASAGLGPELISAAFESRKQAGAIFLPLAPSDGERVGVRGGLVNANPHFWLDPRLAAHAVSNILAALQKTDPANATGYAANAAEYLARLDRLDTEIRTGLAPFQGRSIITFHDAFPYFAHRYGIRVAGVIEKVPEVQPSPRYLGALGETIKWEGIRAIFCEPQSPRRLADQIGSDFQVPVAVLDTLETGQFYRTAYEVGMRSNLRVLEKYLK